MFTPNTKLVVLAFDAMQPLGSALAALLALNIQINDDYT